MTPITKALGGMSDIELIAFQRLIELGTRGPDDDIARSSQWWLIKIRAEWKRRTRP